MLKSNLWCLLTERLIKIDNSSISCIFESQELASLFLDFYCHIAKTNGLRLHKELDGESQQYPLFNDLTIIELKSINLLIKFISEKQGTKKPGLFYCISSRPEEIFNQSIFFIDCNTLSRLISRYYSIHDYFPITKDNIPSNFRQFIINNAVYIKSDRNQTEDLSHAISIISGETYNPAANMTDKMLSLIVLEILAKSGSAEAVRDLLLILKRNNTLYNKIANIALSLV